MKYLIILTLSLCFVFTTVTQEIKIVTESYAPFQIVEEGKPVTGFGIEMVEAIKKKAGLDVEIQILPWARAYEMAQQEPNVFIFSIARTPEREEMFHWIGEYFTAIDGFFSLASRNDIVVNSVEDVKKYRTAVPRKDLASERLEKLGFTNKELHYVTSQKACIRLLNHGRVDLNSNNELGFYTEVRKLGYDPAKFKRVYITSEIPMGLAASLGTSDEVIEKMRKAFEEVKADGTHLRLLKKYFPGQF